ncbi:unnamed protein product, partial [Notodromas monacha]
MTASISKLFRQRQVLCTGLVLRSIFSHETHLLKVYFSSTTGKMSEKCCEPGCKKVVMPAGHSPPLAHYSPAILAGDTLYISGQLGIDADGNLVHDTCPVKQTNQAMENMGAILKAAGMSYEHVVKATVLLADIKDSP